jgi:hypothetical protein
MMPFITRRRHDAEMAKVRAERDQANTDKRTIGAALREAQDEWEAETGRADANAVLLTRANETIDTLQARLDALTPARGQGGRFVGKAVSNG